MTAAPHKNRKSWLLVTAAIALPLILLFGIGGYRVYRVAALQNAMANPAGVALGWRDGAASPKWAEHGVEHVVRFSDGTAEDKGVLHQRLMAAFRSDTHQITLREPGELSANLGSALQRFPSIRDFYIVDPSHTISEGDANVLLSHFRQMKNLEFVYLHVPTLTDTAFASLAGHPKLRTVSLDRGSFTPQILETLKTLPSLKHLDIDVHNNPRLSGQDTEQRFRDALPRVQITFASP